MTENCDELREELQEHKEKSLTLFKVAEELHQKTSQTTFAKHPEAMSEAFAKQTEAIEEIHLTADIQNKLDDGDCEETLNKPSNLSDDEIPEN